MSLHSSIGVITAFSAGFISFLSPCVLPLVPGYISYISGASRIPPETQGHSRHERLPVMLLSTCFVLGFSTVFVVLGATATALSRLLLSYRYEATLAGGAIIILFGVFMTGLIPMRWLQRELRFHGSIGGGRPLGAYLLGLAFGFGWTPCIGPVLGAILTVSAISSTAFAGITLLTVYSMGLGIPFLLSAAFAEGLARRLMTVRRLGRGLQIGAGVVMIVMGVAMINGTMSAVSFWLLENVPMLSNIG